MKRYYDYTDAAILEMSDEGIQRLIEIEIAYDGIMPVDQPAEIELEDLELEKTTIGFRVGGFQGILFADEADAIAVSKMRLLETDYDHRLGSDYQYVTIMENPQIETKKYYPKNRLDTLRAALISNKKKREEHKELSEAWREFQDKISDCRERVMQKVNEAHDKKRRWDKAEELWNNYLELARGDYHIAKNFFLKVYGDDKSILENVLQAVLDLAVEAGKIQEELAVIDELAVTAEEE
jgi:hypothetical protein